MRAFRGIRRGAMNDHITHPRVQEKNAPFWVQKCAILGAKSGFLGSKIRHFFPQIELKAVFSYIYVWFRPFWICEDGHPHLSTLSPLTPTIIAFFAIG
jgi:hypothetical protein